MDPQAIFLKADPRAGRPDDSPPFLTASYAGPIEWRKNHKRMELYFWERMSIRIESVLDATDEGDDRLRWSQPA